MNFRASSWPRVTFWVLVVAVFLLEGEVSALTREDVYRILGEDILFASGSSNPSVLMYPVPLSSGIISPRSESSPIVDVAALSGNNQWFAFVDYSPCLFFPHASAFVFVDDVTGVVATFPATNWPDLNYSTMGTSQVPGEQFIRIVPTSSLVIPVEDPTIPSGTPGDYGDAPEGQSAYPGNVIGSFPSYASSGGAHAVTTGFEMLGTTVSVENDFNDPVDSDGHPNNLDGDADDPFYVVWDPNSSPATGYLMTEVTINALAPAGVRYLNAVMDFTRNGQWSNELGVIEWVVQNDSVSVAPGATGMILTNPFTWPNPDDSVHVWTRIVIDRSPIDPVPFGASGWDGSGTFSFGEVQDAPLYNTRCRPDTAFVDSAYSATPTTFMPFGSFSSYVRVGPVTNEWGMFMQQFIQYDALIVSGLDNPGEIHALESGQEMAKLFKRMGFKNTTHLAKPTPEGIYQILDDFIATHPHCEQLLYVYLVGHSGGAPEQLILRDEQDPEQPAGNRIRITAQNLKGRYDRLKPCEGPDETCRTVDRLCDLTTIVDVCNAGSWENALASRGRRVFMSAGVNECAGMHGHLIWPQWFVDNASWYCTAFINAALVSAQGGAKMATAKEIHAVAVPEVKKISKNTQNPVENLDACACVQPPPRPGRRCEAGPMAIPSNQTTVVHLPITDSYPILRCAVGISLEHERLADVSIVLRSPGGQEYIVAAGLQGTGIVDALFADDGTTAAADDDGTYYGHFAPVSFFSSLVGLDSQGGWQLEITDSVSGIDGTLESACLYLDDSDPTAVPETPVTDHSDRRWAMSVSPVPGGSSYVVMIQAPEDRSMHVVDVALYSVSGQLIRNAYRGRLPERTWSFQWDGTASSGEPVASGIYFMRLTEGGQTRKAVKVLVARNR